MPKPAPTRDAGLDDVQVLGEWNFTLQTDTPLFWIRSGAIDRYLLRFKAHSKCVPSTFGIVFHAEADGTGTDGVSFWVERKAGRNKDDPPNKRYVLAGDALESKPIVTRTYDVKPGETCEDVEMLMQGYHGCIMLQDRKVRINFRMKHQSGSVAFYNTTKNDNDVRNDVFFGGVTITALRRGPLEVGGILARRERRMLGFNGKVGADLAAEELAGEADAAETAMMAGSDDHVFAATAKGSSGGNPFAGGPDVTHVPPADSQSRSVGFLENSPARSSELPALRATAPSGATQFNAALERGAQTQLWAGGRRGQSNRLRQSASEGVLKRKGGASATKMGSTMGGGDWLPLARNAPAGEQKLLKDTYRRDMEKSTACTDFIAM
jgi:hypothetical protein